MMSIDAKPIVFLAITCILLGWNYQLFSPSQAARLLDESIPPTGDGHGKSQVGAPDVPQAGSWTGNTSSPTGTILTPPPGLTTKYTYDSKNSTVNSPGFSSSRNSSALVKTVTPTGWPPAKVTMAVSPNSAYTSVQGGSSAYSSTQVSSTSTHVSIQSSPTVPGSPGN